MTKITIDRTDLDSLIGLVLYTNVEDIEIVGDKIVVRSSIQGRLPVITEFEIELSP